MEILVILGFGAAGVWWLKKSGNQQPVLGNAPASPVPDGAVVNFAPVQDSRRFFLDSGELPSPGNPALVASAPLYVQDPMRFISRTLETQPALTGERARIVYSGGGGPENKGATPVTDRGDVIRQPSWMASEDDYFGAAAPSRVPITAGGGHGQRADDHRRLGDSYGARQ